MKKGFLLLGVFLLAFGGCKTLDRDNIVGFFKYKKPDAYNFKLIIVTENMQNPENDRRCFYKIYMNKIDEGRTTIGLESQEKEITKMISVNRHLLVIEKWVLDAAQKKYVKLNNVQQPAPRFHYFTVPEDRIVVIKVNISENGKAEYVYDFEKR